ncbi:MAG TPA: winged helix-turn-helix domain-containing protein [Geminicoccaceae bacterium]|nr:winged helix-turn-helix domain-containing protein [Geminicoccus sp.]HMU48819.1 winged helix-turn-helix domain-containing protein [Geminicoccaceae bacterium]
MTRLSLRLDFPGGRRLGPGKVALLERIQSTGSISAAGRSIGMSYKRAWDLVDDLNQTFREPVVVTRLGGTQGGGAALTPFGADLVARYRAMEALARQALSADVDALEAGLAVSQEAPIRPPS